MVRLLICLFFSYSIVYSQESLLNQDSILNTPEHKQSFNTILDSCGLKEYFELSHTPSIYDSTINLKARICEGELLYIKNSLTEKRKEIFPDSIIVDKTSSFCFFQKINDSLISLGCFTYLIDFKTNFHIVSLTINHKDFLGERRGIYAKGYSAWFDTTAGKKRWTNANWTKKWEKKLNIEIFSPDSGQIINQNAGVKIFGGMTIYGKEKSLRIIAREKYGKKRFYSNLFGVGKKKYKQFILRHSGNDHNHTRFKDVFLTSIISEEGVDVQKSTPTHLFINSEYWGVYNIREKINDHYIKNNYQIESDSLDIIQGYKTVDYGSRKTYFDLRKYIKRNNLKDSIHFNKVSEKMDVKNFINFWAFQIFIANHDARGNIRFWRSGLLDNKFRWIVYDTDLAFSRPNQNIIKDFTSPYKTKWYNPSWCTFLLRNLLKNKQFETDFINQCLWLLSNKLSTEYLTDRIDWFENLYNNEMKIHFTRKTNHSLSDRWYHLKGIGRNHEYWKKEINELRFFAMKRPHYFLKNLKNKFNIETFLLELKIEGREYGDVKINYHLLEEGKFYGIFSKQHELPIEVIPKEGYESNFNNKVLKTEKDTLNVNITFKKIPEKFWWRED